MTFKEHTNEMLDNLPLILSDSTDTKDVSFTRLVGLICIPFIFFSPLAAYLLVPNGLTIFFPYWEKLLIFFGTVIVANVTKRFAK